MPLPINFDEFEHLQSAFTKVYNLLVREEFDYVIDRNLNVALPRHSLKQASLIKNNDTEEMVLMRLWLFFVHLRKAQDLPQPI